jgi:hypothetical protein
VAIQDLTEDRRVNRAARSLLEASGRLGNPDISRAEPFYRLSPSARFLLVTAHLAHWPYARTAEVAGLSAEDVERRLWQARLALADGRAYPAGAKPATESCPLYDPANPWTQRFLDEEIPAGRERVFVQTHVMGCESCREALTRGREMVYAVDARLPAPLREAGVAGLLDDLRRVDRQGRGLRSPATLTFGETLAIFFDRREVRWALGLGSAAIVVAWLLNR